MVTLDDGTVLELVQRTELGPRGRRYWHVLERLSPSRHARQGGLAAWSPLAGQHYGTARDAIRAVARDLVLQRLAKSGEECDVPAAVGREVRRLYAALRRAGHEHVLADVPRGRPPADDAPRTARVELRVTDERKGRWQAAADAAGMSLSQWLSELGDRAAEGADRDS